MNRNVPNYMQTFYTSVKEDTLKMNLHVGFQCSGGKKHRPPEQARIT